MYTVLLQALHRGIFHVLQFSSLTINLNLCTDLTDISKMCLCPVYMLFKEKMALARIFLFFMP